MPASVIITFKIMPDSPDANLDNIETQAKKLVRAFAGDGEIRATREPVAFGLKQIKMIFVMDEAKGSTDELERQISQVDEVNSVEVVDVRRAVG